MATRRKQSSKPILLFGCLILLALVTANCSGEPVQGPAVSGTPRTPGAVPSSVPNPVKLDDSELSQTLLDSISAAGDYLIKFQLSNGSLLYRVDILDNNSNYNLSYIRLIAGTGALYSACRVTGDYKYCQAGDRALAYYLTRIVDGGDLFGGECFLESGTCELGGAAIAVDTIYKRWMATGDIELNGENLLDQALKLGDFMVWMRKSGGGFYHSMDPYNGKIDPSFYVVYFNGESLMALLDLYKMTDDTYWLDQAREIDSYMEHQRVTQDHWHAYAFRLFAELDTLTKNDQEYARKIAQSIIDSAAYEDPQHSTISLATKIEALSAIALAYKTSGLDSEWLVPAIEAHVDFMLARQLPNNVCGYRNNPDIAEYDGGIYYNCDDPYIRIDALQHWTNGASTFLEYLGN